MPGSALRRGSSAAGPAWLRRGCSTQGLALLPAVVLIAGLVVLHSGADLGLSFDWAELLPSAAAAAGSPSAAGGRTWLTAAKAVLWSSLPLLLKLLAGAGSNLHGWAHARKQREICDRRYRLNVLHATHLLQHDLRRIAEKVTASEQQHVPSWRAPLSRTSIIIGSAA